MCEWGSTPPLLDVLSCPTYSHTGCLKCTVRSYPKYALFKCHSALAGIIHERPTATAHSTARTPQSACSLLCGMDIFRGFATQPGGMDRRPKSEVIVAWALGAPATIWMWLLGISWRKHFCESVQHLLLCLACNPAKSFDEPSLVDFQRPGLEIRPEPIAKPQYPQIVQFSFVTTQVAALGSGHCDKSGVPEKGRNHELH